MMKIKPFRVTDEQNEAIDRIAAAVGVTATDLFRTLMYQKGQEVGISFPLNHSAAGAGLNRTKAVASFNAKKKAGKS